MPQSPGRLVAEVVQLWLLPTFGLAWAAWAWHALGIRGALLWYMLLAPTLIAYAIVIIGAGWLRLWRFPLPYAIRGVPPQIGLIYAGTYGLVFAGLAALVGPQTFLLNPIVGPLIGAIVGAMGGTLYDLVATHYRLLDPPLRMRCPNAGTWSTVKRYGFGFFGAMGLVNVAAFQIGARLLNADTSIGLMLLLLLGVSALAAAPFVAVLLRTHRLLQTKRAR